MSTLLWALLGALIVSLISLAGVIVLSVSDKTLKKILFVFVSFSAGALLGGAFFHLLPEAIGEFGNVKKIFQYVVIGICIFFVLEKVLRWHHCHDKECEVHKHIGSLNLVGDAMHNFLDGVIIISAFSVSNVFGWTILISIALHEIPQEIGDFGVLLYSGFTKKKAIFYNLISASIAFLGVLAGYFLINKIENINNILLPLAAGGFMYIASSGLIPELHKETSIKKSFLSFIILVIALIFMRVIA